MISNRKLFGLVLSGGKSTRMGEDKGLIAYHDMPQREFVYTILNSLCEQTFLSIRADQQKEVGSSYKTIVDTDEFSGPYNGLLSAHQSYPDAAWLVLACDLPLMDKKGIEELISQRDSSKMATTFADIKDPLPEPLCAIWEPDGLRASIAYLEGARAAGARKFLIDSDVKLVFPERPEVLLNANSKSDYEEAILKLNT